MYDVAIIGSGPAGLSAALNLKLHDKSIIWFGSRELSDKVGKSERIANYPGLSMVTGKALNQAFLEQIDAAGLTLEDKMVTNITPMGSYYMILGGSEIYEAKTVILATGAVSGKGLPGEAELLGRGVSYCATCDGFFYRGKTIAVYCGAKRFEHEVEYLANIAEKVYLFAPYEGCEISAENVIRPEKPMRQVLGENRVEAVRLTDGSEIPVDGVFFLRSAVAPAKLLDGLEMDGVHIRVERNMATSKPGCFAAGDCTGRPYQIATAVGQGNTAAHSVVEYLSRAVKL